MSSGPPSALEHVFKRDLIFRSGAGAGAGAGAGGGAGAGLFLSPAMRDSDGRRLVLIRLGAWPPNEVFSSLALDKASSWGCIYG